MNDAELSTQILSDITVYMKYARYLPEKQRRETWQELVTRNMEMHVKKYPELRGEILENYQSVFDKKVLPSMRSMQFAGKPIEISPNRVFNCSVELALDTLSSSITLMNSQKLENQIKKEPGGI